MSFVSLLIASAALIITLINTASNIEIFDSLKHLKELGNFKDVLIPLDIRHLEGRQFWHQTPDTLPNNSWLFLSTKCETCNAIAFDLGGEVPIGLRLIVEAGLSQQGKDWLSRYGLEGEVDVSGTIAATLGMNSFPCLVLFNDDGSVKRAFVVPSTRRLKEALQDAKAVKQKQEIHIPFANAR